MTPHYMFEDSFEHYLNIPRDFISPLWLYFSHGIEPGSFGMGVLSNNFYSAAACAHPSLSVESLKQLANWILNNAPRNSYGSMDKVNNWIKLTDDERRDIMIDCRLRPSIVDVLNGTHTR